MSDTNKPLISDDDIQAAVVYGIAEGMRVQIEILSRLQSTLKLIRDRYEFELAARAEDQPAAADAQAEQEPIDYLALAKEYVVDDNMAAQTYASIAQAEALRSIADALAARSI